MPRGQADQLLDQLVVLALEVELVDDLADRGASAQSFSTKAYDSSPLFSTSVGREVELLRSCRRPCRVTITLAVARLLVAADHDQLLAGEQVERPAWDRRG